MFVCSTLFVVCIFNEIVYHRTVVLACELVAVPDPLRTRYPSELYFCTKLRHKTAVPQSCSSVCVMSFFGKELRLFGKLTRGCVWDGGER